MADEVITEDWLRKAGFRWHQLDRQPSKQWLLWLGDVQRRRMSAGDDIGIEVSAGGGDMGDEWFCWFRADLAGRYSRFIHIRHLRYVSELVKLIEGITGQAWNPANNLYGYMRTPTEAQRIRKDNERLDRVALLSSPKWAEVEKDDSRGRALPEHLEVAEKERLRREKLTPEQRIAEDRRS